jgi:hypothetical protein
MLCEARAMQDPDNRKVGASRHAKWQGGRQECTCRAAVMREVPHPAGYTLRQLGTHLRLPAVCRAGGPRHARQPGEAPLTVAARGCAGHPAVRPAELHQHGRQQRGGAQGQALRRLRYRALLPCTVCEAGLAAAQACLQTVGCRVGNRWRLKEHCGCWPARRAARPAMAAGGAQRQQAALRRGPGTVAAAGGAAAVACVRLYVT